ncbi:MAG: DUF309 domain-containing protein [Candidatus Poribacteria bacterium]|nr:DUF309 domain-containing protein [Candidatus Poribacteria bacterium]
MMMKLRLPKLFKGSKRKAEPSPVYDETPPIEQPRPFDSNWPRYCPHRPFPPYRHVPGETPHPIRDPQGHSYGLEEEDDAPVPLPEDWVRVEDYLYGVDLYNFAYWWEAHEAWEGLWNKTEDDCRMFLQGLIQIAAALIKVHTRKLRAIRTLSTAGRDKIRRVQHNLDEPTGMYMGINLNEFLSDVGTFFEPFFSDTISEETYARVAVKPLIRLYVEET